jgi:hypothetical protein
LRDPLARQEQEQRGNTPPAQNQYQHNTSTSTTPVPVEAHNTVGIQQRFSNIFQVGTTFISQNVLRTTLLLSALKANCLRFSTIVCDTQFALILFFLSFFFTNVQSKRTTRAEPEDHLWSADQSLRNAGIQYRTTYPHVTHTGSATPSDEKNRGS